jgi:branched-chain amino acid transport system ATP-binding protein
VLSVTGLTVDYGRTSAVRGIDLTVGAQDVTCLLGPNGAGKTSALRAISHLTDSSGSVVFDGEDLNGLAPDDIARRGLIHVPEGRRIFESLSVDENLLVGRSARNGRTAEFEFDDVMDLFPALGRLHRRDGWALSGGEQQMVAIGRALMAAPRLLMLDEPALGLAPIVVVELFGALRAISSRLPMLIVEQNTTMALRVCTNAYVLVGGRVVVSGPSSELGGRRELINQFLGQSDLAHSTPEASSAPADEPSEPRESGT